MTADEILRNLEAEGIVVSAEGRGLKVRASKGPLTEVQRQMIVDNKAALLMRLCAQEGAPPSAESVDAGEEVYKEYVYPNGDVLKLTKAEFDQVVEVFKMLWKQDMLLQKKAQEND
jgi:hypothetical protein